MACPATKGEMNMGKDKIWVDGLQDASEDDLRLAQETIKEEKKAGVLHPKED